MKLKLNQRFLKNNQSIISYEKLLSSLLNKIIIDYAEVNLIKILKVYLI